MRTNKLKIIMKIIKMYLSNEFKIWKNKIFNFKSSYNKNKKVMIKNNNLILKVKLY